MEASNIPQSNSPEDNNKMDTLTMAWQEREKNGPWEIEITYGGEADLRRHFAGCAKNPGHLKFIPVDLFGVDHLPSGCQHDLLVEMTRAMSDLTVRVSVKHVSEERPEAFPGSGKSYPFYSSRGSDVMRVGTGWVMGVDIFPDKDKKNNPTCDCNECLNSPTPKTEFAEIDIQTAAHVVWDDLEAAETMCHLFFDRSGTPDVCDGVIALSGMVDGRSDIVGDWCDMVHVTHDLDLAHRLHKMVGHRDDLLHKVVARYYKQKSGSEPDPLQKLAIIVSHPHGCSKQVSVGYCTDINLEVKDDYRQFTYTTATCPGSSGAPVCVIGERVQYLYPNHSHIGNCEKNKELNFGCWAW